MHRYLTEIRTCFRMGKGWSDRVRLSLAGLEFHLSNLLDLRSGTRVALYRIQLEHTKQIYLRRRSGDFFIFHEIFTDRCYALPDCFAPQHETVIVDLGANIGLAALFLVSKLNVARLICIEPNPANVKLLRRNLEFMEDRLEVVEAAVSDTVGSMPFADTEWTWGGHLAKDAVSNRKVRCMRLDAVFAEYQIGFIDVLKIDIEGAERNIFASDNAWLERVGCIIIELHDGYSIAALQADLDHAGFEVLPPSSEFGNVMILALPRKKLRQAMAS